MAQDLLLSRQRRFATAGMLPVGDEELNYIWGRKMAENAVAATPTPLDWGTIVLDETGSAVFGSGVITFDTAVWPNPPWFDFWHLRGGTEWCYAQWPYKHKNTSAGDRCVGLELQFGVLGTGDGTVYLRYYPDYFRQTDTTEVNFTGNQAAHGTWLYRMI